MIDKDTYWALVDNNLARVNMVHRSHAIWPKDDSGSGEAECKLCGLDASECGEPCEALQVPSHVYLVKS